MAPDMGVSPRLWTLYQPLLKECLAETHVKQTLFHRNEQLVDLVIEPTHKQRGLLDPFTVKTDLNNVYNQWSRAYGLDQKDTHLQRAISETCRWVIESGDDHAIYLAGTLFSNYPNKDMVQAALNSFLEDLCLDPLFASKPGILEFVS
jgi:hypothetical protein